MRSSDARTLIVSALVVLLVALVSAQGAPQPASSEQQVRDAARQMLEAAQQKDKDALGRLIADNATWVDRTGGVVTKAEMLEIPASPPRSIDVEKVSVGANNALATGVAHLADGRDARFVQQWVNEGGQWKLMAHQSTIVQTAPAIAAVATTGKKSSATEHTSTWRALAPTLKSKDERDVWKTELALQGAYLRGDSNTYAKLTTDDYLRVNTDGRALTKSEWLELVKQNAGKMGGDLKSNDVRISVNGDYAREIMTIWGTEPGGSPLELMRLTRYFKRTDNRWQQVATAITKIPDE